jgi:hypothetical protein
MVKEAEFDAFVKRQQRSSSDKDGIDWSNELAEWKRNLSDLYVQIEGFIAKHIESNLISIMREPVEIFEENIGAYKVDKLILKIGVQTASLTPVGTVLIGAKGRVDLEGRAGKVRLVLVNADAARPEIRIRVHDAGKAPRVEKADYEVREWAWRILTRPPQMEYVALNRDSFYAALMEVVNA